MMTFVETGGETVLPSCPQMGEFCVSMGAH